MFTKGHSDHSFIHSFNEYAFYSAVLGVHRAWSIPCSFIQIYMLSIYYASIPRVGRWTEQMTYLLSWTLALGWQLWLLLGPALCDAQLFFSVAGLATHFEEREHSQNGGMSLLIRSQKTNFHLASALSLSQSLSLLLTPVKGSHQGHEMLYGETSTAGNEGGLQLAASEKLRPHSLTVRNAVLPATAYWSQKVDPPYWALSGLQPQPIPWLQPEKLRARGPCCPWILEPQKLR